MATPRSGPGNLIKLGNAASPYTPITLALVGEIDGPTMSFNTHDTSSQDTVGAYKQYVLGLQDGGNITFTLFFDPNDAQHASLVPIKNNRELRYWELHKAQSSPGKYYKLMGYISGWDESHPVDGPNTVQVTLLATGDITLV